MTAATAATAAIAALLTVAPSDAFSVASISAHGGEAGAEFIALDDEQIVVGVLTVVPDGDGGLVVAADFDDGYFEIAIDADVRGSIETNLPARAAAARVEMMFDAIPPGPPAEGKFTCAVAAGGAILGCAKLSLWCPLAILATICTCGELVDPEHVKCE